ncbi:MAG: V-type ATP synthase subunit F [Brevinema sp.]
MKVLVLVGEQIAPAFVLAGMEVLSPKDHQELLDVFYRTINKKDVVMLVISARYSRALKKDIDDVRLTKNPIIILEISSSKGDFQAGERLMQQIKRTIGQS